MESTHFGQRPMDVPPDTSLIETMHASPSGDIALLDLHLDRLQRSANRLQFNVPGRDHIRRHVLDHLTSHPIEGRHQRVRLLLDRNGQLRIESYDLPPLSGTPLVAIADTKLNSQAPLLQHKTTHRPWYAEAMPWLNTHPDFFDLIYLNEKDEVCEGSRSNIYLFRDGAWVTPPLECGLLGGVMRRQILEDGKAVEGVITVSDLAAADVRLRLSNGLRGWFDVQLSDRPGIQDRNS